MPVTLARNRKSKRRYVAPTDELPSVSTRTEADLRLDILTALAGGPLLKSELRVRLHERERRVLTLLSKLRKEGRVKMVGSRLDARKWALTSWVVAPTRHSHGVAFQPKPQPTQTGSWWANHAAPDARAEFAKAAALRNEEMATSADWRRIRLPYGANTISEF